MAKSLSSAVGVDIGRFALKSVQLQKKSGNRYIVTNYATVPREESEDPAGAILALGNSLKALFKQLGTNAKVCGISISDPDAIIRIIDQPDTPPNVLRDALRLNGLMLLNQDCRDFVLDCDYIETTAPVESPNNRLPHKRYLVGGLPRTQVTDISAALESAGGPGVLSLQLSPISVYNAFEFAQEEVFNQHAFLLVDIGHTSSTMILGVKREMVLVRAIDFGGKMLLETLQNLSGETREMVLQALEQEDEIMVENTRAAIADLTREVSSSIGFFEGRREETIAQVWISGGVAKSSTVVRVLSEELRMPCLSWNALERCEVNVPSAKRSQFASQALDLSVACGAAAELMKS